MGKGLYDPLGVDHPQAPRWRPSVAVVTGGVVVAAVAIFGAAVALRSGGERGEPNAVVTIERSPPIAATLPASPPAQAAPAAAASPAVVTSTPGMPASSREADVDIENGVRIVRMRPPGSSRPAGQVVTVPPASTPLPTVSSGMPPSGTR